MKKGDEKNIRRHEPFISYSVLKTKTNENRFMMLG